MSKTTQFYEAMKRHLDPSNWDNPSSAAEQQPAPPQTAHGELLEVLRSIDGRLKTIQECAVSGGKQQNTINHPQEAINAATDFLLKGPQGPGAEEWWQARYKLVDRYWADGDDSPTATAVRILRDEICWLRDQKDRLDAKVVRLERVEGRAGVKRGNPT
jgi:hypothetical protein